MNLRTMNPATARELLAPVTPPSVDLDDRTALTIIDKLTWSMLVHPDEEISRRISHLFTPQAALSILAQGTPDAWQRSTPQTLDPATVTRMHDQLTLRAERLNPTRALEQAAAHGHTLLTSEAPEWPLTLGDLGNREPSTLWIHGTLTEHTRALAITGCRASSRYGEDVAAEISTAAAASAVATVAGGAYGIDAAVHRATLGAGGATIAVLVGGLEHPYPAGNRSLFDRIAQSGALISEQPCGIRPTRNLFQGRHRITAALAGASVIVESSMRGGAMGVANEARALLRPLGAVPGPINTGTSAGPNWLIQGHEADLIATPHEALELLR